MSENDQVVIDLNGLKNEKFEYRNLIQIDLYRELKNKIITRFENINQQNGSKNQKILGSGAYFIHGTRGSGKSAFLKSFVDLFISESHPQFKFQLLIDIDPTRIETQENIFVIIIQQLRDLVEQAQKRFSYCQDPSDFENWRKKLKQLAGGVQLLNNDYNPLKQLDADISFEWGLDRAKNGLFLVEHFREFVQYSCQLLNVDAFIIAIDDADTNFEKGSEVLECIRRYIDISEFIVIVAGDLKLYTHLNHNQFSNQLDNGKHYLETDNLKNNKIAMLDHLVDQYTKKIFPLQNRVSLKTLNALVSESEKPYFFKIDSNETSVKELIEQIIQEGLHIKASSDIKQYQTFVLSQPTRSIIQFVQQCVFSTSDNSLSQTIYNDTNKQVFRFDTKCVTAAFRMIFFEDLYQQQIDVDALGRKSLSVLIESVFDATLKDGELDTGCYLRPRSNTESLRNTFVALSSEVAWQTENNLGTTLEYMLQALGSQFAYAKLFGYDDNQSKLNNFKSYFSLGRDEDALNWARHFCASMRQMTTGKRIHFGVIGLNLKKPNNTDLDFQTIPIVLNKMNTNQYIPIIGLSMIKVITHQSELYGSIFIILGLISKILMIEETDSTTSEHGGNLKQNIHKLLQQQRNVVSVSAPNWEGSKNEINTDDDLDESVDENIDDGIDKLAESLVTWYDSIKQHQKMLYPSSVLIGKIWSRLYFNLVDISGEGRRSASSLGFASLMELSALAVINAFLVEESSHHYLGLATSKNNHNLDTKNSVKSRKNVLDKFMFINKKGNINFKNEFPLTYALAICPLIAGLLSEVSLNQISSVIKEELSHFGLNEEDFEKLNQVYISGSKNTPTPTPTPKTRVGRKTSNQDTTEIE